MEKREIKLSINFDNLIWVVIAGFVGLFFYHYVLDTFGKSLEVELIIEKGNPWILEKGIVNDEKFNFFEEGITEGENGDVRTILNYLEFDFHLKNGNPLIMDISVIDQEFDGTKWVDLDNDESKFELKWDLDDTGDRITITDNKKTNKHKYRRSSYELFLGEFIFKRTKNELLIYGRNINDDKIEMHLKQKF